MDHIHFNQSTKWDLFQRIILFKKALKITYLLRNQPNPHWAQCKILAITKSSFFVKLPLKSTKLNLTHLRDEMRVLRRIQFFKNYSIYPRISMKETRKSGRSYYLLVSIFNISLYLVLTNKWVPTQK